MSTISKIILRINRVDAEMMHKAQVRLDNLTKPPGSLGRLEELAKQVVGITGKETPPMAHKVIFTCAGDHGVADEGVSAYPQEVTAQMIHNFLNGGAGINVLAKHVGARVVVVDMGIASNLDHLSGLVIKKINYGTKNMVKEPAMSKDEAMRSIDAGIAVFEEEWTKGVDIVGTGDMGIGNTTPSSAIAAVLTHKKPEEVCGKGTGIDIARFNNKIRIITEAINLHNPDPKDPIDVLSKVGGFEIGGICGIILAAASRRIPVVIDGFISGAAALLAYHLDKNIKDYLIAAHCSVEQGHKHILQKIGIVPLLNLNLRLGEGTGSALGISLVEASVKIMSRMATFSNAHVSNKDAK